MTVAVLKIGLTIAVTGSKNGWTTRAIELISASTRKVTASTLVLTGNLTELLLQGETTVPPAWTTKATESTVGSTERATALTDVWTTKVIALTEKWTIVVNGQIDDRVNDKIVAAAKKNLKKLKTGAEPKKPRFDPGFSILRFSGGLPSVS